MYGRLPSLNDAPFLGELLHSCARFHAAHLPPTSTLPTPAGPGCPIGSLSTQERGDFWGLEIALALVARHRCRSDDGTPQRVSIPQRRRPL